MSVLLLQIPADLNLLCQPPVPAVVGIMVIPLLTFPLMGIMPSKQKRGPSSNGNLAPLSMLGASTPH